MKIEKVINAMNIKKGATIDSFNKHPCNADMQFIALIAYNAKIEVSSFHFLSHFTKSS
jgi:hypothetical protein